MTDKPKNRRRERLSSEAAHELKVVDGALTGLHTETPDDAALTDFAMRLRSTRPTADADAYGRLDARFAGRIEEDRAKAALARDRGGRALFDRIAGRIARLAPLAGALAVLMIGVASVSLVGHDGRSSIVAVDSGLDPQPMILEAGSPRQGVADNSASALGEGSSAPGLLSGGSTTMMPKDARVAPSSPGGPGTSRKVESSGDLVLAARSNKLENVADDVISLTDRFGGYVSSSSVTGGDAANAGVRFSLQFPAAQFQAALAQLSGLAHVRSRTQATQDITDPYSLARDRLLAARAERDRLRTKLVAATSDAEAKVLRARLNTADRRVGARAAGFKRMRNRVNFVSLSLAVVADDSAAADDRGTIAHAVATARDVLVYFAAARRLSRAGDRSATNAARAVRGLHHARHSPSSQRRGDRQRIGSRRLARALAGQPSALQAEHRGTAHPALGCLFPSHLPRRSLASTHAKKPDFYAKKPIPKLFLVLLRRGVWSRGAARGAGRGRRLRLG